MGHTVCFWDIWLVISEKKGYDNTMNIAIVDDNIEFLHMFSKMISKYTDVPLTYSDSGRFIQEFQNRNFDVVFLDIDMPSLNGFSIAGHLHAASCNSLIVFVSSHTELVYDAFGLNIIGFIDKSRVEEQLPKVMKRIDLELQSKKYISVETREKETVMVQIFNIVCCELSGRRIRIYQVDGKMIDLKTRVIGDIYQLLPSDQFVFCNRSCIVNIKMIEKLSDTQIYLKNKKDPVDISSTRIREIKRAFFKLRFL